MEVNHNNKIFIFLGGLSKYLAFENQSWSRIRQRRIEVRHLSGLHFGLSHSMQCWSIYCSYHICALKNVMSKKLISGKCAQDRRQLLYKINRRERFVLDKCFSGIILTCKMMLILMNWRIWLLEVGGQRTGNVGKKQEQYGLTLLLNSRIQPNLTTAWNLSLETNLPCLCIFCKGHMCLHTSNTNIHTST